MDDFEVVHACETSVYQRGHLAVKTPHSPQKGWMTWTVGDSWAPEESFKFALDPHGDWYDEQLDAPVMEIIEIPQQPIQSRLKKRKRSKVAVSDPTFPGIWLADIIVLKLRLNVVWKENYQSRYLDELIQWEGRGDVIAKTHCRKCVA